MINSRIMDILAGVATGAFNADDSTPRWQQQRIDQLEEIWFALPSWNSLATACDVLQIPENNNVSDHIMSYFFSVAEHFWLAGWHSSEGFLTLSAETRRQFEVGLCEAEDAFDGATWPFVEQGWSKWHEIICFGARCQWDEGPVYQKYIAWESLLEQTSRHVREVCELFTLRSHVERELTRWMFQEGFLDYVALAGHMPPVVSDTGSGTFQELPKGCLDGRDIGGAFMQEALS